MSVSEDLAAETKKRAFLAPPPKSGELTPAGRKVIGEMFVFLGSIIVFSTTINYNECGGLCFSSLEGCSKVCDTYESSCSSLRTSYQVISGIVWIVMLIVMSLNLLVLLKKIVPESFTSSSEKLINSFLLLLQGILVGLISAAEAPSGGTVKTFAWLTFFALAYICFQIFRVEREEAAYAALTAEWEKDMERKEEMLRKQNEFR